jgi:hypothetical protein
MDAKNIEALIDNAPSVTKEVFSSITSTKSNAAKSAAIGSAVKVVEEIMAQEAIVNSVDDYLASVDAETLLAFATELSYKKKDSIKYKIMIQPFMGFWIRMLAYLYDLNAPRILRLKSEGSSAYYQIGDGIFLAGVYLHLIN